MPTTEDPQVTVRNIPQGQYNSNIASGMTPGDSGAGEPGIKGHLKRNWPIYATILGVITIIVIIMMNNNNNGAAPAGSVNGSDPYGYGTGNSNPSDLYGSQLDSDYAQMINSTNQTNALLQQLLNGKTVSSGTHNKKKKPSSNPPPTKSPSSGNHGSSGSSGKKKKSGGSSSSGSTKKKTTGSGSSSNSSSHKSTSHSNGKTTVSKPKVTANPTANGAHGWTYTVTKPNTYLAGLFYNAWPSQANTNNPSQMYNFGMNYANNKSLLKSEGITGKKVGMPLPIGTKVIL